MVFINFASQARFECLILHYIVLSSIYKYWNVIFKNQSKMAARNDQENVQNFDVHIFLQIFYKHMFYHVRKPHDRYHLIQRQPLSENHMISA